jgi:hypothetical protein
MIMMMLKCETKLKPVEAGSVKCETCDVRECSACLRRFHRTRLACPTWPA